MSSSKSLLLIIYSSFASMQLPRDRELTFGEAISRENFRRCTGQDPPNIFVHGLWLCAIALMKVGSLFEAPDIVLPNDNMDPPPPLPPSARSGDK